MTEYLENLRLVLSSPRKRAPGTLRSYLSTASIFLTWLGDRVPPSDKDLRRFFLAREEQGINARSRATAFVQLKKLFEANDWPWPFKKEDKPVADDEPFAPAFRPDEVLQLIAAREEYSPQENFYLALAVTYGPRREEIGRVRGRDIQDNTIFIRTVKRGTQRQHLIPEEIAPFISGWRPRERTATAISCRFQKIMEKSGLGKRPGYGFHCIRRTLLTLLVTNLAKKDYPPSWAAEYLGGQRNPSGQFSLVQVWRAFMPTLKSCRPIPSSWIEPSSLFTPSCRHIPSRGTYLPICLSICLSIISKLFYIL